MKLAEKLKTMSDAQATKEEIVTNEIINFFVEKFKTGEMMDAFEKSLREKEISSRKKSINLEFWTYVPGCSGTYFGLLGKEWKPENVCDYRHKGVDLKNIYKDVLCEIAELARENFEKEGFEVKIHLGDGKRFYDTYVIEISW